MLYQPTVIKNEDLVRIHNCTEAVGDHNNCLTFHQFGNRLLNQNFILRVEGCCGLVKQNNGRIFQQCSGDGNTQMCIRDRFNGVFEIVLHDMPRDKALRYVDQLRDF